MVDQIRYLNGIKAGTAAEGAILKRQAWPPLSGGKVLAQLSPWRRPRSRGIHGDGGMSSERAKQLWGVEIQG